MEFESIWETIDNIKKIEYRKEENIDNYESCKNCGSYDLTEDKIQGDIVCTQCGCVLVERIIDEKAEWNYGQEEAMFSKDPSRCGGPVNPLLEKSSLSTLVINASYKNHGNLKRLHQQMSMDYMERSRYHVFEEITKFASDNGKLPNSIVELAKYYYKTLSEKRLSRGNIRKGLIACCIMHACKSNKVPRSVKEISNMCFVDTTIINKCLKIYKEVMDDVSSDENTDVSDLYCRRISSLNLSKNDEIKLKKCINKISRKIDEMSLLNGKTPTAVTAAIIFYCCTKLKFKINKKRILEINNVSSVTLNKLICILDENEVHLQEFFI